MNAQSPAYLKPNSLEEALQAMTPGAACIAGGTDVMVNRQQGNHTATRLIDISGLPELAGIELKEAALHIGAGTTLHQLAEHPLVRSHYPAIQEAALSIASPILRRQATVGGNLLVDNRCVYFNQSEFWRDAVGLCLKCGGDYCIATGGKKACFSVFVSDLVPALLVLDATISLIGPGGSETKPLAALYSSEGLQPLSLPQGTLITQVMLPFGKREVKTWFRKLRPRKSVDFTNLTVALAFEPETRRIKAALSGVEMGPVVAGPELLDDPEAFVKALVKRCRMVENLFYPRPYRKRMATVFLREGLKAVDAVD